MNLTKMYLERDLENWIPNNIFYYNQRTSKEEPFTPTFQQQLVLRDRLKYRLASCGRGVGKTELIITESIGNAITHPGVDCLILLPYEKQGSMVFQQIMSKIKVSPNIQKHFVSGFKNKIQFDNGSSINIEYYKSALKHKIYKCDFLYIDEYFIMCRDIQPDIDYVIKHNPKTNILAMGTPTTRTARSEVDNRFSLHILPSSESGLISQDRFDYLRTRVTYDTFFREFLGSLD